ncbi:type II toxin-antitoxin system VapC family toxin [Aquisphaera insulae]|uniref:type II toxin-antitoxin system VapC family toxin n=1 Tax=Aquisphaera insulae TaxID=2712864 RepID=UPI0013E9A719|nr:type II toxin-antitoxin system VapC family toxin [Aquisphaera insulae]
MRVLLDTCTLAEIRKPRGQASVKAAVRAVPSEELYLSAITVGEVIKGFALLAPGKQKKALWSWLDSLESQFAERILGIDLETGRVWGELTARAQKKGLIIPAPHGLLAATALRHGLHIMTRNTKHFQVSGALLIDPWSGG